MKQISSVVCVVARLAFGISLAVGMLACSKSEAEHAEKSEGSVAKVFGDSARGQAIVAKWCVSCHAVDGKTVSDQVPSLSSVANSPLGNPDTLRAFLNQPHKPMPPLQLTNQEIEDVVAYLQNLKRPGGA